MTCTVETITETLVVTARPPSSTPAARRPPPTSTDDYLQNLPTGRFQPDVLNLAPGINHELRLRRRPDSGNAYQLDGVDISDPEGGTAWSFVNYNIIEEVQLVGLGAPAEYGGFTGVVFNSVTKSRRQRVQGPGRVPLHRTTR